MKTSQTKAVTKKSPKRASTKENKLTGLLQKILRELQEINEHLQDMEDNRALLIYEDDDEEAEEESSDDHGETQPR